MIVCHCFVINDRRVRQLAEEGAITVQDVAEACGASRDCGSCATTIRELLTEGESRVVVAV